MASCYLHNKTLQSSSSRGTRGVFDADLLNTVLIILNAQGMGGGGHCILLKKGGVRGG